MICTAADVVRIAKTQIGYHEKKTNAQLDDFTANSGSNNFTKYARDVWKAGFWNGSKQGFDWCTTFCLWCIWMACGCSVSDTKQVQPYGIYGASCKWETKYYKEAKRWSEKPAVGYQAFFKRGHTGIVAAVNGNKITLIEGNSNNRVEQRTYSFPNAIFTGFGMPRYAPEPKPEPTPEPTPSVFTPYNAKVTPSNGLNVRAGAGTSFKKLGALKCGTVIKILEVKNDWGRITYNGKSGWVCLTYTKKV